MQEDQIVTYCVELDSPSVYVEFEAASGLTEQQILDAAIKEMLKDTYLYSYKTK